MVVLLVWVISISYQQAYDLHCRIEDHPRFEFITCFVGTSALLQKYHIILRQHISITMKLPEHSYLFLNSDVPSYIGIKYGSQGLADKQ